MFVLNGRLLGFILNLVLVFVLEVLLILGGLIVEVVLIITMPFRQGFISVFCIPKYNVEDNAVAFSLIQIINTIDSHFT